MKNHLEGLPPGDQYRQLSLLMLITGGTDPALFELLQPVIERQGEDEAFTPVHGVGDPGASRAGRGGTYFRSPIDRRVSSSAAITPALSTKTERHCGPRPSATSWSVARAIVSFSRFS